MSAMIDNSTGNPLVVSSAQASDVRGLVGAADGLRRARATGCVPDRAQLVVLAYETGSFDRRADPDGAVAASGRPEAVDRL